MIFIERKGKEICEIIDKIIFYILCIITFVLPLIYINNLKDAFIDAKNIFLQFTISILICILILKYFFNEKNYNIRQLSLFFPFLSLFFLGFISISQAKNPYISLEFVYIQICYIGAYFIIVLTHIDIKKVVYLIHLNFLTSFLITIIPNIKNYLSVIPLNTELIQIGSTLGNQNFLSNYLILTIPLGFFLIYNIRRKIIKILYFFILFYITFYFLKTKAVSAWFGLAGSFLIVFLLQLRLKSISIEKVFKYRNRFIIALFVLTVVIIVFIILPSDIFLSLNEYYNISIGFLKSNLNLAATEISKTINISQHQSSLYRLYLWESCLKIIIDYPIIGIGLNNFQFILPFYWTEKMLEISPINIIVLTKRAHNEYLQIASEIGIIGLIVFLILTYKIVKLSYSNIYIKNKSEKKYSDILSSFLTISIFSVLITSLFSFPLQMPVSAFNFWLLVGFQEVTLRNKQNSKVFSKKVHKKLTLYTKKSGLLFLVVFFFISSMIFNYRKVIANIYYKKGLAKLIYEDKKNAEYEFEKSKEYIPYDYELHYYLGRIYLEKGMIYKAEQNFIESIELSDYHLSHYNLAIIYYKKGMLDQSIREFEKSAKLYSINNDSYIYLGILYAKKNNYNEALNNFNKFDKAIKRKNNYLAPQGWGGLFSKTGYKNDARKEYLKARSEFLKILKDKKEDLQAIKTLAKIYEEDENIEEAIIYYRKFLEISTADINEEIKIKEKIEDLEKKLK